MYILFTGHLSAPPSVTARTAWLQGSDYNLELGSPQKFIFFSSPVQSFHVSNSPWTGAFGCERELASAFVARGRVEEGVKGRWSSAGISLHSSATHFSWGGGSSPLLTRAQPPLPLPSASPRLRFGHGRTKSPSPSCTSKGSRRSICSTQQDYTQSHPTITRAMVRPFMSLPYRVLTPTLPYLPKEMLFPHSELKDRPRWFPASPILSQQWIFPHAISSQWEGEDASPTCSTRRGSVTQHGLGRALVSQRRAVLPTAPFHQKRL